MAQKRGHRSSAGCPGLPYDVVLGTSGDNAVLILDDANTMHRFAEAVRQATVIHNRSKTVDLAKRWFRMGAATGIVEVDTSKRRIVGITTARAVRLEAAAEKGAASCRFSYIRCPSG